MTKSSKQKFAHVYENGADFQNVTTCSPSINPRCPMNAGRAQNKDGGFFAGFSLATGFSWPRSGPIDLSRATSLARHVTHDTSRTARHGHAKFPVRGSSVSLLYHTPNLRCTVASGKCSSISITRTEQIAQCAQPCTCRRMSFGSTTAKMEATIETMSRFASVAVLLLFHAGGMIDRGITTNHERNRNNLSLDL
jgi:hypothetical protein